MYWRTRLSSKPTSWFSPSQRGGCHAGTVKPIRVSLVEPVAYLKSELNSAVSASRTLTPCTRRCQNPRPERVPDEMTVKRGASFTPMTNNAVKFENVPENQERDAKSRDTKRRSSHRCSWRID